MAFICRRKQNQYQSGSFAQRYSYIKYKKPSIPVAYAVGYKEEYDTVDTILKLIQYRRFNFKIVADYKLIGILMGLQGGAVKYSCYLCLFDSRDRNAHCVRESWPIRNQYTPGVHNMKGRPLVTAERIIPPPLHIKLGLFKNFVKTFKTGSPALEYLFQLFPKYSKWKITEGVFNGPQICRIL